MIISAILIIIAALAIYAAFYYASKPNSRLPFPRIICRPGGEYLHLLWEFDDGYLRFEIDQRSGFVNYEAYTSEEIIVNSFHASEEYPEKVRVILQKLYRSS